ncbi:MAG: membrane protein insertase YidC [Pseudomonadota bacterium]
MEKNMILAVSISVLILFLWPFLFGLNKKAPETKVANKTTASTTTGGTATTKEAAKDEAITIEKVGAQYIIENDLVAVTIDTMGAAVKQVAFKKYKDPKGQVVKFFGESAKNVGALKILDQSKTMFSVVSQTENRITLRSGASTVEYTLPQGLYSLNAKINSAGKDKIELRLLSFLSDNSKDQYGLDSDPDKRKRDMLLYSADKAERFTPKDIKEKQIISFASSPKWIGVTDRYFLFSVITPKNDGLFTDVVIRAGKENPVTLADFSLTGKNGVFEYTLFMGPKDVTDLRKVDPTLADSIDYGWFTVISVPMLELMKFFYKVIPNYGVAILLLTLLVRLIMFPLQHKSMKSMKKMQELQPHIKALQEKYKGDKAKVNSEMMQFMKTHKVNPMSGCLPMLLQLPVFIALYNVLASSVELYHAPFIFWLHDLSIKDPYYVMPILMGIMMFLQQKMTPNPTMDPTQAKMMLYMLPVIFTVFMVSLPSGLTLYIMFSTLLGILQQHFMNKQTSVKTA